MRDPTGEVNLEDLGAVETAVRSILDRRYAGNYDVALLRSAMADLSRAYRGDYPGLLRCDTLYHDLRHSLDAGLIMARLLDGYAGGHPPGSATGIDADHALLGVLLALFHDIGLIRRDSEDHLWGPALTPIHEERGVEFMQGYLANTTLGAFTGKVKLIMATKLVFKIPESWTIKEQMLASMVATADLVSQLSDRYYLEKCRDFLFLEFGAFGLAGRADSPYPDSQTLLEKTPEFIEGLVYKRLAEDLHGVRQYLRAHMGGADPWEEAIQQNVRFLKRLLANNELDQLRRTPTRYVGDAPQEVPADAYRRASSS